MAKEKGKIQQNNDFVDLKIKEGRTSLFINEFPFPSCAMRSAKVLGANGKSVILTSSTEKKYGNN